MDGRNEDGERITANVRGTEDYYGADAHLRNEIAEKIKVQFARYGFSPFETPIMNTFDLLSYKYEEGAEILDEIYQFSDRGERKLGLRFDLTVPFCKVIANDKSIRMPFRRWEMGHVFRNGAVKAGRSREFCQCDADVVGIKGCGIEAEMFMLGVDVFDSIGIDVEIKWNNNRLLQGLLTHIGVPVDKLTAAITVVDSLAKHTREEIVEKFREIGLTDAMIEEVFALSDMDLSAVKGKYSGSDNTDVILALDECTALEDLLGKCGIIDKCIFSPTLARGENIYTGVIYEFFDRKKRLTCSLGGGGRYDKIIGNFIGDGQEYPAIGISFGMEPIFAMLRKEEAPIGNTQVMVMSNTDLSVGLRLSRELRSKGLRVYMELNDSKFKKVFEIANREGARFTIIIGPKELEAGMVSLKDMVSGEQVLVTSEEAVCRICAELI